MSLGCLNAILKKQEKPKSKLGLPRVTIRDQIIPQPKSPRWLRKKIGYTSINGPPGNCYKRHVRGRQNRGSTVCLVK